MVLVWGVCYTPQKRYPCDRIFSRECKNRFLGFLLLISDLMLAIFTQTSSVTKRNIMDGINKVLGTAYTPHQCSYSDRKIPYWEKSQNNDNMGVRVIIWGILMHMQFLYSFSQFLQFSQTSLAPGDPWGRPRGLGWHPKVVTQIIEILLLTPRSPCDGLTAL